MTGSGALRGAMDSGLFIVASSDGARTMTIEFEARDFAVPAPLHLHICGDGSSANGGFAYRDKAAIVVAGGAFHAPRENMGDRATRGYRCLRPWSRGGRPCAAKGHRRPLRDR